MKGWLVLLLIVLIVLHQDFWWWKDKSLVFGFLPIGLAYHAGYSVAASLFMAVLVKHAWPRDLERADSDRAPQEEHR